MTDYQLKTILMMILDILKSSRNIEEAVEKVEGFLKDKDDNEGPYPIKIRGNAL